MAHSTSRQTLSSDLNVTPMLDVLLVLLVIFMASAQARRAMDVQLPEPCVGGCRGGEIPIVLEVLPGQRYRLNQVPIEAGLLLPRLRSTYAGRTDKVLQVAGSRAARYQDVLSAMDVARSAGVRVIGVPSSELSPTR